MAKFKNGDIVEFAMSKTFNESVFGTFLHMIFKKGKALAQIRLSNSNVVTVDSKLIRTTPEQIVEEKILRLKAVKGW